MTALLKLSDLIRDYSIHTVQSKYTTTFVAIRTELFLNILPWILDILPIPNCCPGLGLLKSEV